MTELHTFERGQVAFGLERSGKALPFGRVLELERLNEVRQLFRQESTGSNSTHYNTEYSA